MAGGPGTGLSSSRSLSLSLAAGMRDGQIAVGAAQLVPMHSCAALSPSPAARAPLLRDHLAREEGGLRGLVMELLGRVLCARGAAESVAPRRHRSDRFRRARAGRSRRELPAGSFIRRGFLRTRLFAFAFLETRRFLRGARRSGLPTVANRAPFVMVTMRAIPWW